jgi:hypothetical protein
VTLFHSSQTCGDFHRRRDQGGLVPTNHRWSHLGSTLCRFDCEADYDHDHGAGRTYHQDVLDETYSELGSKGYRQGR